MYLNILIVSELQNIKIWWYYGWKIVFIFQVSVSRTEALWEFCQCVLFS